MKYYTSIAVLMISVQLLLGQRIADFESHNLEIDTFWNGADGKNGFIDQGHKFHTDFNGGFWLGGWALSTMRDTTTGDFSNLYSAITGEGLNSNTYAVGQNNSRLVLAHDFDILNSFFITNTTYAYLSMRHGDDFAKKFGGETGDDPDYFKLTIYSFHNDVLDSVPLVDFYLADFRFEDNSQDYIVKEWTEVKIDPHLFTNRVIDSLVFSFSSSDVGEFGINTPTFFCMDDLKATLELSSKDTENLQLSYGPNPTKGMVKLSFNEYKNVKSICKVFTADMKQIMEQDFINEVSLDLGGVMSGLYFVYVNNQETSNLIKIIKY